MEVSVTVVSVSRPETTAAVTRGAARLLAALGYAPLTEVTLQLLEEDGTPFGDPVTVTTDAEGNEVANAAQVWSIPMIAQGYKGRAK